MKDPPHAPDIKYSQYNVTSHIMGLFSIKEGGCGFNITGGINPFQALQGEDCPACTHACVGQGQGVLKVGYAALS